MTVATRYEHSVEKPLNREPKIDELLSSYITKASPYDRNHGPIPYIDASTHKLTVDGCVSQPAELSLADLQALPQHEVLCALQCAGNRRHTMRTLVKEVDGIDWFDGAVMNCLWRGPRLRDVLQNVGVDVATMRDAQSGQWKGHVAFACYETECQEDSWYGGSVSLDRAMLDDGDCILALEMNGEALSAKHGAPVRALIPGIAGARSVKWLNRVTLQTDESTNFYQKHDYKILPPEAVDAEAAEKYWPTVPAMMNMPVNSIVGVPAAEAVVRRGDDGKVVAKGYAVPHGMDGPILRVEVSGDEGQTWVEAKLDYGDHAVVTESSSADERQKVRWAWCLWSAKVDVAPGKERRILSRATDFAGNTQPQEMTWNLRGVGYNAWGQARDLEVI